MRAAVLMTETIQHAIFFKNLSYPSPFETFFDTFR